MTNSAQWGRVGENSVFDKLELDLGKLANCEMTVGTPKNCILSVTSPISNLQPWLQYRLKAPSVNVQTTDASRRMEI